MNSDSKDSACCQETCVLPTVTIMAILESNPDWQSNRNVQHFLRETPLTTNYLIETHLNWTLHERQKMYKILPNPRASHVCFSKHIMIPNLNTHCELGLSKDQADELKALDSAHVFDWSTIGHSTHIKV